MIDLIKNNISWDRLPSENREKYQVTITRAVAKEGFRSAELYLKLNFIIPFENLAGIKESAAAVLPGVENVLLKFNYENILLGREDIFRYFLPYMKEALNGDYGAVSKTIDTENFNYNQEANTLEVYALGETSVKVLNDRVTAVFASLIKHFFGMNVSVSFLNSSDAYEEKNQEFLEHSEKMLKELEAETEKKAKENAARAASGEYDNGEGRRWGGGFQQGAGGFSNGAGFQGGGSGSGGGSGNGEGRQNFRRRYEGPADGNRLLGKGVKGDTVKLSEIRINDPTEVTVEAMVFKKEAAPIKNNYKLILYMTDSHTSAGAIAFISEKKYLELDELIKVGDYLKISGVGKYDSFEKSPIFEISSIEKAEKPEGRVDTCPRKRIELHAHTKMSKTDGFNDIENFIDTAAGWGHKAVAITDHGVVLAFPIAAHHVEKMDIKMIYGVEGYLVNEGNNSVNGVIDYKSNRSYHIILLVKSQVGMQNMYRLISESHLNYFYKVPRMPKSVISKWREGIIIGSACEAGEVFQAILNRKSEEEILNIISFYDYLEIQPRSNNMFLVRDKILPDEEAVLDINRKILAYGKKLGKPVVATCDTHYTNPEDYIYRKIIMAGHGFKDTEEEPGLYFRTTDEMLEEFAYLGPEDAEYVVIDAPAQIADMIEPVKVVPDDRYPPDIPGCEERLENNCYTRAANIYGDPLPEIVKTRLDKELSSVIGNGYAVMYVAAEMLVQKSLSDGYLVGSRGSVGSSFAATMGGITEVNPLPPHYICPNPDCKNFELGDAEEYDCGVDMPDKVCPKCGTPYKKDGFSIPFEVFLGFEGDKEPDIDLNFAGEYQPIAHKYVEEIFGSEYVFKAGTVTAIQDKTAMGYVRKYFEEKGEMVNKYEMERLAMGCNGVRKSTGQHPGGMVIVPKGHEVYEFCPVQHPPKDDTIITTHFEYHSIDKNLLKLDILGHDTPSMIRALQDMTGVAPENVPLSDKKVNSIFLNTEGLEIKDPDYMFTHGTFGIPEFGTPFTRQMLDDIKPTTFSALVRIAGFSHGTDVWLGNAQTLIRENTCSIKEAIATRDDIMNYLIKKGVPANVSFKIMESVRKGKGLKPEWEDVMRENDVPEWYLDSCKKIQYMFPKAHAVAYVMMSYRIAYFKVYYPLAFYAVCFSRNVNAFNAKVILSGKQAVIDRMAMITAKGRDASPKEKAEEIVFQLAYEMMCRGYEFENINMEHSEALNFSIHEGKLLLPFNALEGMGEVASIALADAVKAGPFLSVEDMQHRAGLNKKALETLAEGGLLEGLPEQDQMSLF